MRAWTLFATSLALAACLGRQDGASPSGELRIAVAPLSLPGLVDACYALAVTNEDNAPVWSRSELCASRFGSPSGDLSYVGTCDASDSDLDGDAANTVTLTILRLLGPPATEGGDPVALTDWQNPCAAPHNANGCQLSVACRENADSRVDFDLTILRDARQGFFDVAVSFDDLFCSAKVDCADEDGPLLLVHGPDGTRVPSVVLGLTCTDGDAATSVSDTTHLYLDPVAIRCGASRWEIAPWLGPGNLYPAAGALPPPIVQAMVFRGVQALGPDNVDTVYWNTALGLNAAFFAAQTTGTSCILETRATASRGPLEDGLTPASAIHPIIEIAVTLNSGSTMTCTQHPLNGEPPNDGVRTSYAGTSQLPGPLSFAAVARRGLSGQVESFFVDACADCDVNASCQPAAPENERCDCLPGFFGDGETCTPCSPIAHCGGDLTCTVLTDSSCSSCEPGYEEPDCSNVDECVTGPAPCDPNATCTDTDGDYSCACKPGFFGDGETCTACTTVAQCEGQVTCTSSTDSACADCAEGFGGPNCIAARVVFDYTGALQNYTVPAGVTAISVRLWGAGGGACSGSAGGGGYASGTLAVTAGQSLSVLVGGAGSYPSGGTGGAGGFGGGGAGGNGLANAFDSGGCGGGGRSEVVHVGGTLTAGGGGGSGAGGVPGTTAAGGGATGQSGSQTTACYGNGTGGASGSGGGGGVGGAGGTGCANGANGSGNGLAGVALTGGQGGSDTSTARGRGGGGGGGGFGGGGGGGASDSWSCGVGGGGGGRTIAGGLTVTGSQATPAMSSDPQRGSAGAPDQPGRVVFDLTF